MEESEADLHQQGQEDSEFFKVYSLFSVLNTIPKVLLLLKNSRHDQGFRENTGI